MSVQASFEAIYRRAGGRRRYNAQRKLKAHHRRCILLLPLLREFGLARGAVSAIARGLGVSLATASRDIKWALKQIAEEREQQAATSLAGFDPLAEDKADE
jgi:hypothetical protein